MIKQTYNSKGRIKTAEKQALPSVQPDVELMDGRVLTVPLAYYPTLLHATDAERNNCQPIGAGYGIEWPVLDYHLSVEGLMQGLPEAPALRRMKAGALTPA